MSSCLLRDELNFRDLGGVPTFDGRFVKDGFFYRSCKLSYWRTEELNLLSSLPIKIVLDLRTDYESYDDPDPALLGISVFRVSGMREFDGTGVDFSPEGIRKMNLESVNLKQHMCDIYVNMMFHNQAFEFVWLMLKEKEYCPLLFHCASGKDRTGAVAALLYLALGVPKEYIMLDYLVSNMAYKKKIGKGFQYAHVDLEVELENYHEIMMEDGVDFELGYAMIQSVFTHYVDIFAFFEKEYKISREELLKFRSKYTEFR